MRYEIKLYVFCIIVKCSILNASISLSKCVCVAGEKSGFDMLVSFGHLCSVALSIYLFLITTEGSLLFFKLGQCASRFPIKKSAGPLLPL